ncbi:MAG: ribosome biogenesis GTPase Der [Myxococcales bacterium]|nr:ribosome biogenesis GTPase Der [Myxococcales bacterium]
MSRKPRATAGKTGVRQTAAVPKASAELAAAASKAPLVAVVGRPNVGKSTLFNRFVGGRPALVHDTPGLTRDRRYGDVEYFGRVFRIVDTGGLDPDAARDVIGAGIHRQAHRALAEADAILFVLDGAAGLTSVDVGLAKTLRTLGKPVFVAVNKIDSPKRDNLASEFFGLGFEHLWPVSAAHGRGMDDLVDAMTEALGLTSPIEPEVDEFDELFAPDVGEALPSDEQRAAEDLRRAPTGPLRVAFIGKPNAGKSSLANRLIGEERSLVHDQPGTTTDPVDTEINFLGRAYTIVDTAGIRRKARIEEDVEKLSVTLAISQLERADVAVLVIDASLGPSEQDARLAGMVADAGRALLIVCNKSDLLDATAAGELAQKMKDNFHFMSWAPYVLISAARGDGVDKMMDAVDRVSAQHRSRISTSELNKFFAEVCEVTPPPIYRGQGVRIYYITQGAVRPPTFVVWANQPKGISPSYKRFLMNQLRERYGFRGTPLRVFIRNKSQPGA